MTDDIKELSPQEANLLAKYQGAKPDAPSWFEEAVATPYEEHFVELDGIRIRYQAYGDPSLPGLLLCHGNGAHAHWYDFIAPSFATSYRVNSMSFSGMGESSWRDSYNFDRFSEEQIVVCEHAGLFEGGRKPVIVAHSFGGFITMNTASKHSDKFAGVMIVDSGIRPPEDEWSGPPVRSTRNRVYASLEAALARFRLAPAQPCENHYIVDYIARHSLKEVQNEAGQTGWTWKFDPDLWGKLAYARRDPAEMLARMACPVAFFRGAKTSLVTDEIWAFMRAAFPDAPMSSIPEAQHHLILDQPLAVVAALDALMASGCGENP